MLRQLIYVSKTTQPIDNAKELEEILKQARANNKEKNITGMLLYDNKTFLQVIEGDKEIINALYEKIEHDPRHTKIKLLLKKDIEEKEFGKWNMAFANVTLSQEKKKGFVDLKTLNLEEIDSEMAQKVFKKFLEEGYWQN